MSAPKPLTPLTVLIVDDQADNRTLLETHLKRLSDWALRLDYADDAEQALRMLRQSPYDLVFLDQKSAHPDELHSLEKIRQLHPKAAVVVLTSRGSERVAVSAMKKGALDYLTFEDLSERDLGGLLRRVIELRYLVDQNRELHLANQMKDEFIANVSHELRTPLSVIMGYAEALKGEVLGPLNEAQGKALDAVVTRSKELLKTLNQILRIREIHEGKLPLVFKPLELRAFLTELAALPSRERLRRNISLELDLPPQPVWARADEEKFREAVDNLLSNAVKFGPEDSAVRVSLASRGGEAVLCVKDEGRGIPEPMLPRLFERFSAAGLGPTREHPGLGLGLPLTKHVIEQHSGRVWLESGEGRGCAAYLALPLCEEGVPEAKVEGPGLLEKKRVLLVEDSPDMIEVLMLFLSGVSGNLELLSAKSGFEALERIKEGRPDLIILDLMMPGMNGFEVITRLRKAPATSRIPVMVLTGYANAAQQAREIGAQEVLLKPLHEADFVEKVLHLLRAPAVQG